MFCKITQYQSSTIYNFRVTQLAFEYNETYKTLLGPNMDRLGKWLCRELNAITTKFDDLSRPITMTCLGHIDKTYVEDRLTAIVYLTPGIFDLKMSLHSVADELGMAVSKEITLFRPEAEDTIESRLIQDLYTRADQLMDGSVKYCREELIMIVRQISTLFIRYKEKKCYKAKFGQVEVSKCDNGLLSVNFEFTSNFCRLFGHDRNKIIDYIRYRCKLLHGRECLGQRTLCFYATNNFSIDVIIDILNDINHYTQTLLETETVLYQIGEELNVIPDMHSNANLDNPGHFIMFSDLPHPGLINIEDNLQTLVNDLPWTTLNFGNLFETYSNVEKIKYLCFLFLKKTFAAMLYPETPVSSKVIVNLQNFALTDMLMYIYNNTKKPTENQMNTENKPNVTQPDKAVNVPECWENKVSIVKIAPPEETMQFSYADANGGSQVVTFSWQGDEGNLYLYFSKETEKVFLLAITVALNAHKDSPSRWTLSSGGESGEWCIGTSEPFCITAPFVESVVAIATTYLLM